MHELTITNAILRTVLRHARRARAAHIHRILLVVSELSDLQPVWIQHYFDRIAAGTPADGARLEIVRQAPDFVCCGCDHEFAVSLRGIDRVRCPECGSADCALTSHTDYVVQQIEVS